MSKVIAVRDLSVEVLTGDGPHTVVDGLSFDVDAGETLSIIGESGSGKSVAMQAILGLAPTPPLKVTSGTAVFEGHDLLALREAELCRIRGNRIGFIFQEPMSALNPMMTVGDQIAEVIRVHRGASRRRARDEAVRLIERVRIPDAANRAGFYPAALSGGMRQRVVIAAALACKPALVVADEPTTALDATVQAEILGLLLELRSEVGCAVVFITHDMAVVRRIADRVLVMRSGKAMETGRTAELLDRPRTDYTRALIKAARPAASQRDVVKRGEGAPPLSVKDLIVSYPVGQSLFSARQAGRLFAVDGVSLDVGHGETLALVGESGSGKTTLARAVMGLVAPEAGSLRVAGVDIAQSRRKADRLVQFIFQDPQSSLDPRYRAWQAVTEPLHIAGKRKGLKEIAAGLLVQVGLGEEHLDRLPHELSGGQRQRLGIARALSIGPRLVIADEAVSALDATTRLQVLELFQQLQCDTGLPFLFITHDFAVVSRVAHRVAVMRYGRLVEIGPTRSVLNAPQHPYTQALIAASEGGTQAVPAACGGHRIGPAGSQPAWSPMREIDEGHFFQEVHDGLSERCHD
ncbi:MAG: ABC transporter ATP-binding protein [Pseudomonadota bacterium]|nr:ABC transporter ATP-binding protein [Pseudomonadota bacterium]